MATGLQETNRREMEAKSSLTSHIVICKCIDLMPELSQFKAEFFKALAHPLRIRVLDELRRGEVGVNELGVRLDVEQSTLSQQLAILRSRSIVVGRKDGQSVLYSVRDPEIFKLLDVAKRLFNNHLIDVKDLLSQLTLTSSSKS